MENIRSLELAQNPGAFIERTIRDFIRESPLNRLEDFGGDPIFTDVQVGYASGDDPIFHTFRKVVHPEHLLPLELLRAYVEQLQEPHVLQTTHASVVAFALSRHPETFRSNAVQTAGPSLRWNHSIWYGETFTNALLAHIVDELEAAGVPTLAPSLSSGYRVDSEPGLLASNWSHRHAAYAAGLGSFSLTDGFITPKGMAVWCGSLVTQALIEPTPRVEGDHRANCLQATQGTCGLCIARCPANAISKEGHNRARCVQEVFIGQKAWLEGAHGPGYIGMYAGCGLCMTGLPCSTRIPG